ncbi:MAG: hypothetical protein M1835_005258 [Candelina submexicana]|nr:MAG: hypothetical protein M1835_005258 [Candelina submexicana]
MPLSTLTPFLLILLHFTGLCRATFDVDGLNQGLLCDTKMGAPPAASCSDTLTEFDEVIKARGYDPHEDIEFRDANTKSQFIAIQNEVVDVQNCTFYRPAAGNSDVCVLEFKIYPVNPAQPVSVISNHAALRSAAEDLIAFCVFGKQLGGSKIVGFNSNAILMAFILNGNAMDVTLQKARQSTIDYRPSWHDDVSSTGSPGAAGGSNGGSGTSGGRGGAAGAGGVGPDDKGKGFLSWYCNKLKEPGICLPGFTCSIVAALNQIVMWGAAVERVKEFVGFCTLTAGTG